MPILTLTDRIEPRKSTGSPVDVVRQQSFVGDLAVSLITKPAVESCREEEDQIHVTFHGIVYRFPASDENREAVRMFLGKLGGLG